MSVLLSRDAEPTGAATGAREPAGSAICAAPRAFALGGPVRHVAIRALGDADRGRRLVVDRAPGAVATEAVPDVGVLLATAKGQRTVAIVTYGHT